MQEYILIADATNGRAVVRLLISSDDTARQAEQICSDEGLSLTNCVWQVITSVDVRLN